MELTRSAVLGATFGAGLFCVVGARRHAITFPARRPGLDVANPQVLKAAATFVGVAVVAFLTTGWPIGAALSGLAALSLRRLFGSASAGPGLRRTEAVATWAEMLRDTMAGAAGLEEALTSTARVAPLEIRDHVQRLAARMEREPLGPALRDFGAELADPAADLVVAALSLARDRPASDLGALLGALAQSTRMEAHMVLRVEAGRSRLRTAARVVALTTLGFAGVLVAFNRPFLAPYDDALGQSWLLMVGGLFALALKALERMAAINVAPRLLAPGSGGGGC
ncbi:MAG: hypothetical protein HYU28_03090 [Actinobacteria bacterium]|nr:hypothetical protein [Actinomycetota bacterium]